ncbi:MAG: hypothetical protein Q8P33_01780 [bacterium]|nr:hypothetical protein [bacterium]
MAANGSAIIWQDKIYYFFQGLNQEGRHAIGLATSEDGFNFIKEQNPVLEASEPGAWDSTGVADPYVVIRDGQLHLYYLGLNGQSTQRLGVATSSDGKNWIRNIANPIIDVGASGTFDENGTGEPSIAYSAPFYYLLYTGRDAQENRNIGYAISYDGVNFKKVSTEGLLSADQRGDWAAHVICDTTILPRGDGLFDVWFGGGNKPEPAENLNGQVGYLRLDLSQNRDMSEFVADADWSSILVESTDVLFGSFGIQDTPDGGMAWAGEHAQITLIPDERHRDGSLVVKGWVPARTITEGTGEGGPSVITLVVGGREVASQQHSEDESFSIAVPWHELEDLYRLTGTIELEIRASKSFVPAQIGDSADERVLAMRISSIRFE